MPFYKDFRIATVFSKAGLSVKLSSFLLLFVLTTSIAFCQQKDTTAANKDTIHRTDVEQLLIKQEQQNQLDSVLKEQWKNVLDSQPDKRRKALESNIGKILFEDSLRRERELKTIDSLKKITTGHPVMLHADTLFLVYVGIGAFGTKERTQAIAGKIKKIYELPFYYTDTFKIVNNGIDLDIVYDDITVLSVSNLDAMWFGQSKQQLAEHYKTIIASEIEKERQEYSFKNRLRRILVAVGTLAVLLLLIRVISLFFRRIAVYAHARRDRFFKGVTFRKFQLISQRKHLSLFLRSLKFIKAGLILLMIYASLSFLFSLFPTTMGWTETLLSWILTPAKALWHAFVKFLPDLFTILVIYFVFNYLIKIIRYFVLEIEDDKIRVSGFHRDWARPTFNILRFLLYAFMLVIIFPYLPGSHSPAFQGVSVFLGVLLSLGSSSAISNIVSGLVITYMRPFRIGDRVQIGEVIGDVTEKNMLVTRIRTIKNEDITIPNSSVLSSSTINYSSNTKPTDTGLILHTTVTIGYDTPWQQIHRALINAANRTDLILQQPEPFVLQTSLDDFYVSYQLNAYTKDANEQANIYSQLHQNIQDCCAEAGIEIMSPHYRSQRDGNTTTIPEQYWKEGNKSSDT
ncbi:mechanosensitive ion channel family protein [Pinibacter soli]|uniref:Mechanosensitive ion channel family protein n=1 Tax=Pinibacter soli TaxID=3044211 RepID=A0ABT6RHX6_9BACT|nr:mechanosensitive ion channel family protein [Pinibacter soli]MDI3321464.1 mechanosensitive ion channel family protein [Pinibacter soli]